MKQLGFEVDHVTGSHYILIKGHARTSVPYHGLVKAGTLRAILRQANITIEQFVDAL
jgi:predicted RNA binding protein YcfA (HicA-like mRNA interferase family)